MGNEKPTRIEQPSVLIDSGKLLTRLVKRLPSANFSVKEIDTDAIDMRISEFIIDCNSSYDLIINANGRFSDISKLFCNNYYSFGTRNIII